MLVLIRHLGESIYIGDDTKVTILGIQGSQVRVGIKAPKAVSVHREEVYQRIQAAELQRAHREQAETLNQV